MLDFSLIHDGQYWIAERESMRAKGETLPELDRNLLAVLKNRDPKPNKKQLKIRMTFDNRVIPEWIRQYSNHYFNRIVTLDFGKGD